MTPINPATTNVIHETVSANGSQLTQGAGDAAGASLLPDPASTAVISVDAGQIMATLMIESAFARRTTAREAKLAAESAMVDAQKAQLHQMREAADQRYEAAQVDAWVQIGSGGLTLQLSPPGSYTS